MRVKNKVNIDDPVFGLANKIYRVLWSLVYWSIYKYSPVTFFGYRRFLLRAFGAKISTSARIYPSAKIWCPANLRVGDDSTIGPYVRVYNQGEINIGRRVIVSQYSYICASTHDYNDPCHPLILSPILIEDDVWIGAEAFIGPGVTVSEGGVVGARAVQTKTSLSWTVNAGNPSTYIKDRVRFRDEK